MSRPTDLQREWWTRASEALAFAEAGFGASRIPRYTCFLSHQAAELGLKGLIAGTGEAPPRIHDLVVLLGRCAKLLGDQPALRDAAFLLNPWYQQARYPLPAAFDATPSDAEQALLAARRILGAVGCPTSQADEPLA